jgi:hypothetical protein
MSTEPGWPTKIIPFARPEGVPRATNQDSEAFPRFRREWNRPNPPIPSISPLPHAPK